MVCRICKPFCFTGSLNTVTACCYLFRMFVLKVIDVLQAKKTAGLHPVAQ